MEVPENVQSCPNQVALPPCVARCDFVRQKAKKKTTLAMAAVYTIFASKG